MYNFNYHKFAFLCKIFSEIASSLVEAWLHQGTFCKGLAAPSHFKRKIFPVMGYPYWAFQLPPPPPPSPNVI